MSESRQIQILLEQAERQRVLGNHHGATGLAQRALSLDPNYPIAHAALAAILLDARRLPAAIVEIRIALSLEANDPYIHRIAATVLTAERKLDEAWKHCLIAMQDRPTPEAYVLGAEIRDLAGDRTAARELLHEALTLDSSHTGALTELARLALREGNTGEASRLIDQALGNDPAHRTAHVVAGHIALARGDTADAEHHARFVLHNAANDRGGLALWVAIQAHKSPILGTWWRWNAWLTLGTPRRRIAILLGGFVVVRTAVIIADAFEADSLARTLSLVWLGLCAYTWFAPVLFRRMIARTLQPVRLDPDF